MWESRWIRQWDCVPNGQVATFHLISGGVKMLGNLDCGVEMHGHGMGGETEDSFLQPLYEWLVW